MIKLNKAYDWIVIGDHPGALLSACLALRAGLSVLLLPKSHSAHVTVSSHGHPHDPETNWVLGLAHSSSEAGILNECLAQLGATVTAEIAAKTNSTSVQIMTDRLRILLADLPRAEPAVCDELKREFFSKVSESREKDLQFWKLFPEMLASRALEKKSIFRAEPGRSPTPPALNSALRKNLAMNLKKDPEFWQAIAYALQSKSWGSPQFEDLPPLFNLASMSTSFRGGITAYKEFLISLAEKAGAHIMHDAEVSQLFVEDGVLFGVQLVGRGDVVRTRCAILGYGVGRIDEKITQTGKNIKKLIKAPPAVVGWKFTLSVLVARNAMPPGLEKLNIYAPKDAPLVEIERAEPSDYNLKSDGKALLFLRTILPFHEDSLNPNYQAQVCSRMLRVVCSQIPFLDQNIEGVFPDFRDRDHSEQEMMRTYGFSGLDMIPENLRCYASSRGVGFETGLPNLFVACGESYPNLDSFGATIAALEALQQSSLEI